MPAPYMWLNPALEDALYSYLATALDPAAGATVYRLAEATAMGVVVQEPMVGVLCASGRPLTEEAYLEASTSTRVVSVRLVVRTHAEDARAAHGLLVGMVMDALCRSDIVDVLNAQQAANLAVDHVDNIADATQTADRSYVTELTFDVVCHVKGAT